MTMDNRFDSATIDAQGLRHLVWAANSAGDVATYCNVVIAAGTYKPLPGKPDSFVALEDKPSVREMVTCQQCLAASSMFPTEAAT
jgi:hypothetical protein